MGATNKAVPKSGGIDTPVFRAVLRGMIGPDGEIFPELVAYIEAMIDAARQAALATHPQPTAVSAPTDEVTQEQAVLLAGIQALCISTNQELSRRDGSLSEFDKGWFLGQLHIFDMYTPVEKGALNEAREYLRAITSAQAPQQTMRSLYEIQRDAAESAIGDDLARLMLVDPAGKAK